MAKHTSALCNACRIASSKTANPVAKRHFVQSAKEVANSTANLVKTIKVQVLLNYAAFFLQNQNSYQYDLTCDVCFKKCLITLLKV